MLPRAGVILCSQALFQISACGGCGRRCCPPLVRGSCSFVCWCALTLLLVEWADAISQADFNRSLTNPDVTARDFRHVRFSSAATCHSVYKHLMERIQLREQGL